MDRSGGLSDDSEGRWRGMGGDGSISNDGISRGDKGEGLNGGAGLEVLDSLANVELREEWGDLRPWLQGVRLPSGSPNG